MAEETKDNKEPLIKAKKHHVFDDVQQPANTSLGKKESMHSQISVLTNPRIYDLPDMENITKGVICKLATVSVVCLIFLSAEIVGGLIANSLAILSDAAHLFSDLSGFFISIFSIYLGQRPASGVMSFGYHRAEVIGAMASIVLIWGLTVVLVYEATMRIVQQTIVDNPLIMLATAGFGLFCNLVMAKILHSGPGTENNPFEHDDHEVPKPPQKKVKMSMQETKRKNIDGHIKEDPNESKSDIEEGEVPAQGSVNSQKVGGKTENKDEPKDEEKGGKNLTNISESDNYNLRAAMIHVIGDIIQSLGVLLAAFLIYFFHETAPDGTVVYNYWQLADPLCTYLFSILVMGTTIGVAKECVKVLMEGTPMGIEYHDFKERLKSLPKVKEVHDLHIWSLSVGKPSMSAHVVCSDNPEKVLRNATKLSREFGIYHSTIQVEVADRIGKPGYIKCEHNIHN